MLLLEGGDKAGARGLSMSSSACFRLICTTDNLTHTQTVSWLYFVHFASRRNMRLNDGLELRLAFAPAVAAWHGRRTGRAPPSRASPTDAVSPDSTNKLIKSGT